MRFFRFKISPYIEKKKQIMVMDNLTKAQKNIITVYSESQSIFVKTWSYFIFE